MKTKIKTLAEHYLQITKKNWIKIRDKIFLFLIPIFFSSSSSRLLTHLSPMHPFSTPWKHQKTSRFFNVFREWRKGSLETNGLNKLTVPDNFFLLWKSWLFGKALFGWQRVISLHCIWCEFVELLFKVNSEDEPKTLHIRFMFYHISSKGHYEWFNNETELFPD